jgi:hypothetical protein
VTKGDDESGPDAKRTASRVESSRFERTVSKGRKITLTLEGVALHLPGEAPVPRPPTQDALPPVSPSAGEEAHMDAWSADRVRRSSFPPSAPKQTPVPPPVDEPTNPDSALLDASAEAEGDALALAGRRSRPTPTLDLVSEMSERFALGDFSGALRAAELVLGQDPEHESARHYAHESRQKLEGLFLSRLSSQGRVPKLALPESEIRWLGLDSRTGFLLSRIDGSSDYETVVELSGMPRLEALRSLVELVDAKVIRIV